MINAHELLMSIMRDKGKADALALRENAPHMTGTEIINEESKIPTFNPTKDYTSWKAGAPVIYNGQVYGLLQPYNAAHYPDSTPENTPALWRVVHTTDPAKAKPYVKPTSTSDMYLKGECMLFTDGIVYHSLRDTVYSPEEYAADWEAAENG